MRNEQDVLNKYKENFKKFSEEARLEEQKDRNINMLILFCLVLVLVIVMIS